MGYIKLGGDIMSEVNIESIIKLLKPQVKYVVTMRKLDGITMECSVLDPTTLDNAINEMQALSIKQGIQPISVEKDKNSDKAFAVQYPELLPIYTDEEMKKMYLDNFKFLFDNIKMKDPTKLTRTDLVSNMETLTAHAIKIYCKSNLNQYKSSAEEYLKSAEYRGKINGWYLIYMEEYLNPVK